MNKFKVGDRVRQISSAWGLKGSFGTVLGYNSLGCVGIEFDKNIDGHDCGGFSIKRGKVGHCRWYEEEELEPLATNKIVITSDGTTTLARLYDGNKVIKSASAKCSPSDTYDFATGANLAYDRLMRPEVLTNPHPTFFSGKVICTASRGYEQAWKIGKVYQFKDGYITDDTNRQHGPFYDFTNFQLVAIPDFLEVTGEQS